MAASMIRCSRLGLSGFFSKNCVWSSVRCFSASSAMRGLDFDTARDRVTQLQNEPDNTVKLQLYALFKQSTSGKCNAPKPGALDFVGKAKWNAWNSLGDISKDEAQKQYIGVVEGLIAAEGGSVDGGSPAADTATQASDSKYKNISVSAEGKVHTILLNRPTKKNALSTEMYRELSEAMQEIGKDPSTSVCVLTGAGDFYCSGNDLSNFANIDPSKIADMAREGKEILLDIVNTFIDFPKPLIGAVNGPAVGVAVTTLGLCDVVYATDRATFQTPMVALGQSSEGCSSYMFPKIMGVSRASEMLLFGKKINAQQAYEWGLVTEVFPDANFHEELKNKIAAIAALPKNSLRLSKKLLRDVDRDHLKKVNAAECEILEERWQSDECFKAIMDFFQQKAKL